MSLGQGVFERPWSAFQRPYNGGDSDLSGWTGSVLFVCIFLPPFCIPFCQFVMICSILYADVRTERTLESRSFWRVLLFLGDNFVDEETDNMLRAVPNGTDTRNCLGA